MTKATTGFVSTFAGNGLAEAELVNPPGLGDGGLAINARISPVAVAFDAAGNVLVSEFNGQRVRLIADQTGIITTFAGNGLSGFSGNGGAAISAKLYNPWGLAVHSNGTLFIADSSNCQIRAVVNGKFLPWSATARAVSNQTRTTQAAPPRWSRS